MPIRWPILHGHPARSTRASNLNMNEAFTKALLIDPVKISDRFICSRPHDLAFRGGHGIGSQALQQTVAGNEQEKGNGQSDDDAGHLDRDQSAGHQGQ